MGLDDGTEFLTCPHCEARVYVSDFRRPIIDRVREPDQHGPRTFVIIGRDRLLHNCPIPEDK